MHFNNHWGTDEGSELTIQGYKVHLPPVGYVWNHNTGELQHVGVWRRSTEDKECHWDRRIFLGEIGVNYDEYADKEDEKRKIDKSFRDQKLEAFRRKQWQHRLYGFWFRNNDEDVFISGLHFFMLTSIFAAPNTYNQGFPDYYKSDQDFFIHFNAVVENPRAYGSILLSKRRSGKTLKAIAFLLDHATRTSFAHAGIQSKTDTDAELVVYGGLLKCFDKVPRYFKPIYDLSGGLLPKKGIDFKHTPRRGFKSKEQSNEFVLNSSISFKSSNNLAYDGSRLTAMCNDEFFKIKNSSERLRVLEYCIKDNQGKIIGKIMNTSTVENIDADSLADYVKIWDGANPEEVNTLGATKNGYIRYFLNSSVTRGYDKYGNYDEQKNVEEIMEERKMLRGDSQAYNSKIRKEPLSVEEAFRSAQSKSPFNMERIDSLMDGLTFLEDKDLVDMGRLEWSGDDKSSVVFVPDSNGRFWFAKGFLSELNANNVINNGRFLRPNSRLNHIGVDPISHGKTATGQGSRPGLVAFQGFKPGSEFSEKFIMVYVKRPQKAEEFFDDVHKSIVFLGCKALIENNKIGCIKYLQRHSMDLFLQQVTKNRGEPGIPTSTKVHELMFNHINDFIESDGFLDLVFKPLVLDYRSVDPMKKLEKYDYFIASALSLIQCYVYMAPKKQTTTSDKQTSKVSRLFRAKRKR